MKTLKKLKETISFWITEKFGTRYEVSTKPARNVMRRFFQKHEWPHAFTITNIQVFYKGKNTLEVQVETHRPGLLIGKGGHFINKLTKVLQEELGYDVNVNLKECKLWSNI